MKFTIVAKREYLKMIKSKAFWFATFLIPMLLTVIILIQSYAQDSFSNKLEDIISDQKILIFDELNVIPNELTDNNESIIRVYDVEVGINKVKQNEANALIVLNQDIINTKIIEVYAIDGGLLTNGLYDELIRNSLKAGAFNDISNPIYIYNLNNEINIKTKVYNGNTFDENNWFKFVIPLASVIIYFIFTSFATSNLLLSVSEEKENRMIEIVLSSINSKTLIWGKIIGLVSAVLTQILILIIVIILILSIGKQNIDLPIDISLITINPIQLIISLIYLLFGFLILANTMVACGAAMPSYREASNFSSVFIMLSIFPIYFFTIILADPNGIIAIITSYFPFTSSMILMLRNALDALPAYEIILSFLVLSFYVFITAKIAYKTFEFGAMEYNNKISFKNLIKTIRNK